MLSLASLAVNSDVATVTPMGAAAKSPSQLLVLGMHHSGTSLVSNFTMMLGAYGGKTEDLLLHPENPLKFWERADVVGLDEQRLLTGVREEVSKRYEVPDWVAYGFDATKKAMTVDQADAAKSIVGKLNAQRPWVTKDPRMCLVASEWMKLLDAPACIIVHREPLSVANSMMIYSHNVSLAEWVSVYETYYQSAMRACEGHPTVVVQHEDIVRNPFAAVRKLHADLSAAGVRGLTLPAEARVHALLKPSAHEKHAFLASERAVVGPLATSIAKALSTAGAATKDALAAPAQWRVAPLRRGEAFATLLTTANPLYLRGALVLGSSIRSFDATRDMVALVTAAVPKDWHKALSVAGWTVKEVPEVSEFWWGKSAACSKGDADQGERWGHMATKLRLWQLTQYSRIMYLDADAVLTGAADGIFATVKGFAAEKPRYHSHFNAGVLLLSPSERTFQELLALGSKPHATLFNNVVDCTEQALLNTYYNGQPGREVSKLAVGRADVSADWESTSAPFAVHWITHACPKPWLVAEKAESVPSHCDPLVYKYWARLWDRLTTSVKDESSAAAVGSRQAARRKMRRLAGVVAGPSMVARRASTGSAVGDMMLEVRDSIGRQLREVATAGRGRRLRRRRQEYDEEPWSEGTWAWIAIIGTLVLGLGAGALLHKLFIKAPTEVGQGMTVVQAKRMGFAAVGTDGGVVSAVDDEDDDEEEEEYTKPGKK